MCLHAAIKFRLKGTRPHPLSSYAFSSNCCIGCLHCDMCQEVIVMGALFIVKSSGPGVTTLSWMSSGISLGFLVFAHCTFDFPIIYTL